MNAPVTTEESTALSTIERTPTGRELILHSSNLDAMVRVADLMAKSQKMVPAHLRNNPGGCLALTMQAMRWNMDPFALAAKTFEVNDLVGYEAQAIISALNNSPLLKTRLQWNWEGDWSRIVGRFKQVESKTKKDAEGQPKKYIVPEWDFNTDEEGLKVTVSAILQGETEPRTLELFMKQARTRNSPLWTEDPKQQLAYLAAKRWGRLYAPDVIMGVYTPDELQEREEKFMGPADVVGATPAPAPGPFKPAMTSDDFAKRESKIREFYSKGKTAADIIAFYEQKFILSDAQQQIIRNMAPDQVQDAAIKVTYAQVADLLTKATNVDALAEAEDLIRQVANDAQRAELNTLAANRRAAITSQE